MSINAISGGAAAAVQLDGQRSTARAADPPAKDNTPPVTDAVPVPVLQKTQATQAQIDALNQGGTGPEIPGAPEDPRQKSLAALAKKKIDLPNEKLGGPSSLRLRIEIDAASGQFVYLGVNPKNGEVVQQYPTKEVLARLAALRHVAGLVVDRTT